MALAMILGCWMCASVAQQAAGGAGEFDPMTLKPFTDGLPYLGEYETGLYPGGRNEMPVAHRQAGRPRKKCQPDQVREERRRRRQIPGPKPVAMGQAQPKVVQIERITVQVDGDARPEHGHVQQENCQ